MKAILEIDGFLDADGARKAFVARISEPKPVAGGDEYSCSVHAPLLFKHDKEIFGIDADQARELAVQFLKSMLEGKHLTDKTGRTIDPNRLS